MIVVVDVEAAEVDDALTALAAAELAVGRRLGRVAPTWSLVGVFTRGRLLAPAPSG